ncbi:MAG TPA: xanthine dehydrogenase family protein subunit M [Dehalococcoidia bacterium]|nr:xanthine dehydrogenase family protein subunit M [Dehalococcoidia bacterium]
MKPPPFEYHDPETLEEAVRLLAEYEGEAKVIAGGQSLMPLLNMRLARPQALVDLRRIAGLDYIRRENGGLAIGALTRQRDVERSADVAELFPLLQAATRFIAHPQIRNRGTIGGSMAHADPAAELPAVAVSLDATFAITGPQGERAVAAGDFFVSFLTTSLGPEDVLTEVRFPGLGRRMGWSFQEVARRHGDFALAGVAVALAIESGKCRNARVALFGVAGTPVRARRAEQVLEGETPSGELMREAAMTAAEEMDEPVADIHASAEYRRHVAGVLTRRALEEAASRAAASTEGV